MSTSPKQQLPTLKFHYPKSQFILEENLVDDGLLTHSNQLCHLVRKVCASEINALREYFEPLINEFTNTNSSTSSRSLSKSAPSKEKMVAIEQSLVSILQNLPSVVQDACPEDAIFLPELNSKERKERKELLQTRRELLHQSSVLAAFEQDIAKFNNKFNLLSQTDGSDFSNSEVNRTNDLNARLKHIMQTIGESSVDDNPLKLLEEVLISYVLICFHHFFPFFLARQQ